MSNLHGFTLKREEYLEEISSHVRLFEHDRTGASLLSVCNDDENKCFGVNFRTPPSDSTGVAHILEHSVLCGSEKYPVKEPFVELLKSSLQTFLNAMTYPDKTCYPVASTNLTDFYNLISVYIDAVFHPIISEDIFYQEGWHLEATEANGQYSYKGVVFNEMKGVYSSPDSLLAEHSQHAVFPDNTYGLDSGGNPEVIPLLSYDGFKYFHEKFYHPSNSFFFFWGDDDENTRLKTIDEALASFDKISVNSEVELQKMFDTPRYLEYPFPCAEGEDKGHINVNWLFCENNNIEECLALEILDHILLGLPGSPLRKALIDSGLGEDLTGSGLERELRQLCFSVGLRSISIKDAQEVEVLIMDTLADLAEEGIPSQAIEAALNSIEFALRENNSGRVPRGLAAMLRALTTWLHDGDPFAPLAWQQPLNSIRESLKTNPRYFEELITKYFLDNQHRATVVLVPDEDYLNEKEKAEQEKLNLLRDVLTATERKELVEFNERLLQAQKTPDSEEALASIPSLELKDLAKENKEIPCKHGSFENAPFYAHNINTNGIVYANILFKLDNVPNELIQLLPLFARALTEVGTNKRDFVELGLDISSKTGGIDADVIFSSKHGNEVLSLLNISAKASADKVENLFEMLNEIISETNFDNKTRFMQMLFEERARLEQMIIPSGHSFVASRIRARYSSAGHLTELTNGYSYLLYLRELSERADSSWSGILSNLQKIKELVLCKDNIIVNITANEDLILKTVPLAKSLAQNLKPAISLETYTRQRYASLLDEALIAPSQINFIGKGCNLYELGYKWNGSALVIARHLRMARLWDKVRVQGGAYGVFCNVDRLSGIWTQVSYRDPQIESTLYAYRDSATWLKNLDLTERDLTNAIVGAVGDIDTYLLPDGKGMTSLMRNLTNDTEEMRQQLRDEVLSTSKKDYKEFAEILFEANNTSITCGLGGKNLEEYAKTHKMQIINIF